MKNKLGKKIKKLRLQKGITQEQLANELDVDYKTISLWECGNAYPKKHNMIRICENFNVNEEELNGKKLKKQILKYSMILLLFISLIVVVYNFIPKDIHYQIVSDNPDFEVKGEIIYNSNEQVFRINSIKVLNKEKYKDIRLYDCSYSIRNENDTYYYVSTMYGGYDSWDDPTYELIKSLENINIEENR